jgi:hypothetical protein
MANLPHITRFGMPVIDRSLFGMSACHSYSKRDHLVAARHRRVAAALQTRSGRIRAWAISHRQSPSPKSLQRPCRQRAGTLRYIGHSRSDPLHHIRREAA